MVRFIIKRFIFLCCFSIIYCQLLDVEVTLDKKKLIILTNEDENNEIMDRMYEIASSSATQLQRYEVMDRRILKNVLKEQKLQHSGVMDNEQAVEIGKIATANEALLINMQIFEQKGIELIENTAEEIKDLVIEMVENLESKKKSDPEDEELQKTFRSLYASNIKRYDYQKVSKNLKDSIIHGQIRSSFGTKFLKKNRDWLR